MKQPRSGAALAAAPLVAMITALVTAAGCARPARTLLPGPIAPRACEGAAEVTDSVFLVGDAGKPSLPRHPEAELPVDRVLRNLREDVMEQAGGLGVDRVAVIYLGDNVYPNGLVPTGVRGRKRGERILRQQITAAGPARVIFLAGDHDWDIEGPRGWDHVRAQHGFLSIQGERVSMLPPGGCGGPERFDFGRHLRFVLIDPIGLGHASDHPERHAEVCAHDDAKEAFLAIGREFDDPDGRHMVLAMHHPLASDDYPSYVTSVYRATRLRVPILFVGGHEHSLQLHRDAVGAYYAVSGSGSASEVARVEPTPTAMYAEAEPGYMRLDAHADGALTLSAIAIRGERRETTLRHCIADGPPS